MSRSTETIRRMLALACLVPLLVVGATACAPTKDYVAGEAAPSEEAETPDGEEEADALESLSSAELLELGMSGETAVRCDFERGDTVGTIYFHSLDQQRFDSLNPDRAEAHIVMHEGRAHAWVAGASEGVRYPKPDGYSGLVGEDLEDVKAHSTNCIPHADLSVFNLPAGVDFVDLPTGQ